MNLADFGQSIDSETIKKGLRELCSDIHFDMGTNLGQWHPMQPDRQGVYHHGRHICSMDRGVCPEFKVWSVEESIVPASFSEVDNEEVSLQYVVIPHDTPGYEDAWSDARKGRRDDVQIRADGNMVKLTPVRVSKVRGRCIRVGWRHTFERLILANIPGVTREALAAKFNVDMLKFPVGGPLETYAQIMEE